jgi:hypothetical protein
MRARRKLYYATGFCESPLSNPRQRISRVVQVCLLLAMIPSCGPELSEPNQLDISGRWTSTDAVGTVSNISLAITQNSDGTVGGNWSARFFPPDAACPPGLKPASTGPVNGTNTVLDVRLAILGVGDFSGQLIDRQTLKGSLLSCSVVYRVTFSLAGPIPG